MISLKNIIILILTFIFIYLIFEYFYKISPKIIESFDFSENVAVSNNTFSLKDIPSQFDINITKVGGLEDIESQITLIKQQQDANQKKIDSLNFQITGNK
jgi:hypothetical protein